LRFLLNEINTELAGFFL